MDWQDTQDFLLIMQRTRQMEKQQQLRAEHEQRRGR